MEGACAILALGDNIKVSWSREGTSGLGGSPNELFTPKWGCGRLGAPALRRRCWALFPALFHVCSGKWDSKQCSHAGPELW